MSIESWKKEFYPVPAEKVAREDAIDASILKWKGVLKKNLTKHGLTRDRTDLLENGELTEIWLNDETCALCQHHYCVDDGTGRLICSTCPLKLAVGDPCNETTLKNPYHDVAMEAKPVMSMIRALEKAKKLEKKRGKR